MQNHPASPNADLTRFDLEAPNVANEDDAENERVAAMDQNNLPNVTVVRFSMFTNELRTYQNRMMQRTADQASLNTVDRLLPAILGSMLYVTGFVKDNEPLKWIGLTIMSFAFGLHVGKTILHYCKGEPQVPDEETPVLQFLR